MTMMTASVALSCMSISTWVAPQKYLWETVVTQSLILAIVSTSWLAIHANPSFVSQYFQLDEISTPLLVLTLWLTPPTLIASQSKLSQEPLPRQRAFIFTIITLQLTTLLAFTVNNLALFFILFEATIIPTLTLITRWGAQMQRMAAGSYLIFFTLFGSMLLLTAILIHCETVDTLSLSLMYAPLTELCIYMPVVLWWFTCFFAFFIKVPMFGLHLWLPKAHVEAPIAGSMILAGTLLKLGGYGIIRMNEYLNDSYAPLANPFIIFSLIGVLASAILCARQTDLKALIAFSSVSHMGLVIAASLIKTEWSIPGAMILMISHGLISSALFCLANILYERSYTRTLLLLQGSQIIFPLMAAWWLFAILASLALPPSPNFIAELITLSAIFHWSEITLLLTGMSIICTTIYSLYLFWASQREHTPPHLNSAFPLQPREHLLIALHIIPTILLILKPDFLF